MLFTEFSFVFVFLPVTLAAFYWTRSVNASLSVLVGASLIFYGAWNYLLVPVLVTAIVVNYAIARRIERTGNPVWFYLGIALALIPLAYFKYSGFLAETLGIPVEHGLFGETLGSLLPLGISFYTFQQITYLADVRTGRIKPGGFLEYAFFKTFFPQLIAGPIVHYAQLVPQIGRKVDRGNMFAVGVVFFVIGFVKKFFIADGFAEFSDPIFDATGPVSTQDAIVATLGYTFQLYFDFSGYSDMALGLARLFGFELPLNFNSPYKARSIADFWRRWHMTLSQFLRAYVYIPLGGNRRGQIALCRNLLLTMLIGGLWHGAAWTFVAWGGLHGLALVVNHLWTRYVRLPLFGLGWPLTFVLVAVLWVLFRATSFDRAFEIYQGLLAFNPLAPHMFWIWVAAGVAGTFLLPNSQQIAAEVSARLAPSRTDWVAGFCRRLGIYAAASSIVLYALAALYYTTPLDRYVFTLVNYQGLETGMDNKSGDFRNNLWSQPVFGAPAGRVVVTGSSFSMGIGTFEVTRGEAEPLFSQTVGTGGNGLLNGLRQADAVIRARAADVVLLAVSPLNFGDVLLAGPFEGQCTDGLAEAGRQFGYEVITLPAQSCLPTAFDPGFYLSVFSADRTSLMQFRGFVHLLTHALGRGPQPISTVPLGAGDVDAMLADMKRELEERSAVVVPVGDPKNGQDADFEWWTRQTAGSLRPGGLGYVALAHLKRLADANGVRLLVYETPTPSHEAAPHIYPTGYFEQYQAALRPALGDLGIPYLDLSRLFPWSGEFMRDFVHLVPKYRSVVHKILLSWLLHPESLKRAGILPRGAQPEVSP